MSRSTEAFRSLENKAQVTVRPSQTMVTPVAQTTYAAATNSAERFKVRKIQMETTWTMVNGYWQTPAGPKRTFDAYEMIFDLNSRLDLDVAVAMRVRA